MTTTSHSPLIAELIRDQSGAIRTEWETQLDKARLGNWRIKKDEQRSQCDDFISAFAKAMADDAPGNIEDRSWSEVRQVLDDISSSRAKNGSTPFETASFVFSFEQPLFAVLNTRLGERPDVHALVFWMASTVLDRLGLYTVEVFQRSRDQIVARQQQELLELSTPVITLWEGVLALPLIGTLDSMRAQVVMESILQKIVDTGATIAIIDITGVPPWTPWWRSI